MDDLKGMVGVVTGAASGIGYAFAERFASEGLSLVLADIDGDGLDRVAAVVGERTEVLAVPTDVTDALAVEALRDRALERFGVVDIVCNNAGVGGFGDLTWEGPIESWEWILGVNLWGVLHGVRAFVPHLIERDRGHIVNTGSLASLTTLPGMGPYCVTKHAVLALSETLAHELAMRGSQVRVHVLCPGFLRTGIADSERTWPARLGPPPSRRDDPTSSELRTFIHHLVDSGLAPELAADQVVDAIRTGQFLVTTHPDEAVALTAQRAQVVAGGEPRLATS